MKKPILYEVKMEGRLVDAVDVIPHSPAAHPSSPEIAVDHSQNDPSFPAQVLVFFSDWGLSPADWLSIFPVHQNAPRGLFQHKFLDSTFRYPDSIGPSGT